jgi:uncharacterized protein YprB with RNaseH-like and TPR domain
MESVESLYQHLKSRRGKTETPPLSPDKPQADAFALPGFDRTGEFTWRRVFRASNPLASFAADEPLLSARAPIRDLLFFDTETTGLSGGAGNIAFLLGAGYIDGKDIVIEQHFLADFPGERDWLELLRPLLAPEKTFVSYNGSSFDSHLLMSRFRMNRLEIAFPRQYDLLHPSRRLWKASVGACSLKNIERLVLGVERGEDIDGAEVPEYYFRFLRTGDPSSLEPVFYHNRIDVLSLVLLLQRIESLVREPESLFAPGSPGLAPDAGALGQLLLGHDPAKAEMFLVNAHEQGHAACGLLLGYLFKRRREYEAALRVWERLFAAGPDLAAGIELAMHLEHRARDIARALEVVNALFAAPQRPTGAWRHALEARRARLERKINHG